MALQQLYSPDDVRTGAAPSQNPTLCLAPYLQEEDFSSVRSCVGVMPRCVLVHSGSSLWLPWIPVLWDIVLGGEVLQDGVAATHDTT